MYTETVTRINTINRRKVITILFIVFSIILFLITAQTLIMALSYDKVFDGVYLNNDRVSHLSKDELSLYIDNKYNNPLKNATMTFVFGDKKWSVDTSELNLTINKDMIIKQLYAPGHEGDMMKRFSDIVNLRMHNLHVNIFEAYSTYISYDQSKVDELAEKISKEASSERVQHLIVLKDSRVIITAGHTGYYLAPEKIKEAIVSTLENTESFRADLSRIAAAAKPDPLIYEEAAKKIVIPAQNAKYAKNNKSIIIVPHKYGQTVDTDELSSILKNLDQNPDKSFELPLIPVEPEVKSDQMKIPEFKDLLGENSTKFTSDRNRTTNIKISSEFINGTILLPGEIFSFNGFVGDTTEDKGYKPAGTYVGGKIVDSYGGGVCQVSSTLYNSVINAGLEVVKRSPHSFIVSYVHPGLDAAIAYPGKDLQFKNSFNEPVMIIAQMKNSTLTFKLMGTKPYSNISYKFEVETLSTTDFKTVYINDPSLAKGKTSVVQTGAKGYSVKTYRITLQDGKETKKELFSTSKYTPRNKIIARGTKE